MMSQVAHDEAGCQSDRLASAGQIAAMLGVSRSTVQRLAERGDLVAVRLSARCTRYRVSDVEALIARKSDDGSPNRASRVLDAEAVGGPQHGEP